MKEARHERLSPVGSCLYDLSCKGKSPETRSTLVAGNGIHSKWAGEVLRGRWKCLSLDYGSSCKANNHWLVHFTWVNLMVCNFDFDKVFYKKHEKKNSRRGNCITEEENQYERQTQYKWFPLTMKSNLLKPEQSESPHSITQMTVIESPQYFCQSDSCSVC